MRVRELNVADLTYCTNVHPGESWQAVRTALTSHVLDVRRRVAPQPDFGVGLRLAAEACRELGQPATLAAARAELDALGLYVFTLNGFPYGAFHGTRVKERVYEPDWTKDARLDYTNALAHILAELLPEGQRGSISTVPGCFKPSADARASQLMVQNLVRAVHTLVRIERDTGKLIQLALEPEPACFLETSQETRAFFEDQIWTSQSFELLAELAGLNRVAAERALRLHLGVCLDTCHAAVEFESPLEVLRSF